MPLNNEPLSILISSCDNFSDLWEHHVAFYHENWVGQPVKTYLVTDKDTDIVLDNIEIIVAPSNYDFPMRIKYALQFINAEYVLLTLDDYFIIEPVYAEQIFKLVEIARKKSIDYLMLYDRRKVNPKRFTDVSVVEKIDLNEKYAVTLYPAIWKKRFLYETVHDDLSPWLYEVSLTKTAKDKNASCYFSPAGTFIILDVVRKGKVLHKANSYFKRHGVQIGDRPIIHRRTEIKLRIMELLSWHAPRPLFRLIKKVAGKFGMRFFSED